MLSRLAVIFGTKGKIESFGENTGFAAYHVVMMIVSALRKDISFLA